MEQRAREDIITNLIAMEAPKYGSGNYSIVQILDIFNTATTAFTVAKIESLHETKESANIIICHSNRRFSKKYGYFIWYQ